MDSATPQAKTFDLPTLVPYFGPAPHFLHDVLASSRAHGNETVLLGDQHNKGVWSEHWDCGNLELPKFDAFLKSYAKMSDYGDAYEFAFWRRPFVIEAWMRANGVSRAFVLDADVMTFANYAKDVLPALPAGCQAGLMTPEDQPEFGWTSSLHFSYWTLEALADFTSFCEAAYRTPALRAALEAKYRWHLTNRKPGGICEMTLLYMWRQATDVQVCNFAKVWNGMTADLAIGTSENALPDEYEMRLGQKHMRFRNGRPYAQNRLSGKAVRFVNLHCQGESKGLTSFLAGRTQRYHAEAFILRKTAGAAHVALRSLVKLVVGG